MNNVRELIGVLFKSPVGNMNYPAYFQYLGTSGKITQRTLVEVNCILLEVIEEQEKKLAEADDHFKNIFEVLTALVEKNKKIEAQIALGALKDIIEDTPAALFTPPPAPNPNKMYVAEEKPVPSSDKFFVGLGALNSSEDKIMTPKILTCDKCDKTFTHHLPLAAHKKREHPEKV